MKLEYPACSSLMILLGLSTFEMKVWFIKLTSDTGTIWQGQADALQIELKNIDFNLGEP